MWVVNKFDWAGRAIASGKFHVKHIYLPVGGSRLGRPLLNPSDEPIKGNMGSDTIAVPGHSGFRISPD